MAKRTCSIDGCDGKYKGRGWCKRHYDRWRYSGDPMPSVPRRRYRRGRGGCAIPGCERKHYARDWCRGHWEAWKRHGDPNVRLMALKGQADYYDSYGYHNISVNGRIMREHRHVMEQQLGRSLRPGENVHHKNGLRWDNHPANLELWLEHGQQPKGSRAADLLAWAEEIVARYGPERDKL